MFNNIRKHLYLKIAVIILFLIFLFAGLMSYILYSTSIRSLKNEAYERLSQMAIAYGNELNIDITNTMQITETLGSLMKQDFDEEKVNLQPQYLNDQIERFAPYIQSVAQEFSLAKTAYIYYNWKLDGAPHDLYFVDHDDDGIVTRQDQLPISYFENDFPVRGEKDWWFGPIESKKGFWSPPYDWIFDDGSKTTFISYTQAVFNDTGRLIGVAGTDFKYSNLTELMARIQVYETGFSFLMNEDQVFLVHPKLEGKRLSEIDQAPYPSLRNQIGGSVTESISYEDADGQKWHLTYYQLKNNWTLGLVAPISEITASAQFMSLVLLILLCIATPIIILVTFYVSRRMTDPLHELTETVRQIKFGEYTTPINKKILNREDEIGTLAHVIQLLGISLSEKITEILLKNQQLQVEMEEKSKVKDNFILVYEAFIAAKNGMIITDKDYIVLHANPAFSTLTDFDKNPIELSLETILQEVCNTPHFQLEKSSNKEINMITNPPNRPRHFVRLVLTRIDNRIGEHQYIGILEDQTERMNQAAHIDFLKEHDAQTGLLNKATALNQIKNFARNDMLEHDIAALFTINIDDFRLLNEAMGYDCGDAVILAITTRFKHILMDPTVIARVSGDEFLMFIKKVSHLQEIEVFGQTILSTTKQPIHWLDRELFVTLSVGISILPFDTDDIEQLFSYSEAALNNAKNSGKNTLKYYSKEMAELSFEKYELSTHLREAITQKEFFLMYQPIIEVPQRTLHSAEALIRWQHPVKGVIGPDRFIALAEANGTIVEIGDWVIEEVCHQLITWKSEGVSLNNVSINLSSVQLDHTDFAAKVERILQKFDILPSQINLEITESALILQHSIASQNLEQLKEAGFEIHIDDFGTGFSSLSYLRDFKIDVLKIDRSFVKGIPDQDNGELACLIIDLSRILGIHTIAEGVETTEQLDYLLKNGCQYIQGYLFSKPLYGKNIKDFIIDG